MTQLNVCHNKKIKYSRIRIYTEILLKVIKTKRYHKIFVDQFYMMIHEIYLLTIETKSDEEILNSKTNFDMLFKIGFKYFFIFGYS